MAGTRQGILMTPDDNRQPFAWLPGPSPVPAHSVSAAPAYDADSTLFAGTNFGVFRSTNRGLSWQRMTSADSSGYPYAFPIVRVSPAYATDGTVFATVADLVNVLLSIVPVHPHVCGEILRVLAPAPPSNGSPPRVWGNRRWACR